MATVADLEKEIELIKQRNKKVEGDKAWELSWSRKIIIGMLTYIVIYIFFLFTKLPDPFINSTIAVAGFIISTLTLSFLKEVWIKYFYKK